jgi:hypothetical protein
MNRPVGTSADELLSWIEADVGISAARDEAAVRIWRAMRAKAERSMGLSELRVDELTSLQATARSIQKKQREREREQQR